MVDGQEPKVDGRGSMADADSRGPAAGSREQTGAMGRFTMAIDNEYWAVVQRPQLALFGTPGGAGNVKRET